MSSPRAANAPSILLDWLMNAHGTQEPAGGDAFDVYPGDDYVDVVGIDPYDMTPSSPDEAAFVAQCEGREGICAVADFARRHGKLLGVNQWAVVTCNGFGDAGGDSPFFVQRMHEVFEEKRRHHGIRDVLQTPERGAVLHLALISRRSAGRIGAVSNALRS